MVQLMLSPVKDHGIGKPPRIIDAIWDCELHNFYVCFKNGTCSEKKDMSFRLAVTYYREQKPYPLPTALPVNAKINPSSSLAKINLPAKILTSTIIGKVITAVKDVVAKTIEKRTSSLKDVATSPTDTEEQRSYHTGLS